MRIRVDTADGSGGLALAAVMTGDNASRLRAGLKAGMEVRVKGSLKAVRRRLKSGLVETAYEVMAESMEIEGPAQRGD